MITVLGNCHARPIAEYFEAMTELKAKAFSFARVSNGKELSDVSVQLAASERIFVLSTFAEIFKEHFPDYADRLELIPHIRTPEYHPDLCNLMADGARLKGPMDVAHLKIVYTAFKKGMSEDEILALFNSQAYRELGYLNYRKQGDRLTEVESKTTGWNVEALVCRWRAAGCFLFSPNHPKQIVFADLAREMGTRLGLEIVQPYADDILADRTARTYIWPVYPGIAENLGARGGLRFKPRSKLERGTSPDHETIDLQSFIRQSLHLYRNCGEIENRDFFHEEQWERARANCRNAQSAPGKNPNPYRGLPDHQFWKRSISSRKMADVDPVVKAKFRISSDEKVATAGSCFAQHISNTLAKSGFNYFVPESGPAELSFDEKSRRNYGTFSARFGNIYTTRQLLQLIDRAYGKFTPELQHLFDTEQRLVDPLRPGVEPDGFESLSALRDDSERHLQHVREMFEEADVFVFTLGLTEGWRTREDGTVFPIAPGAVSNEVDRDDFEFFNMTAAEVIADLDKIYADLKSRNPALKIILTVSPVPLIATYEDRHVLTATTYSKSALRVAADHMASRHADVMYFPSYEIITGNFNRGSYYEDDLRGVRPEGVAHVMKLFMRHCAEKEPDLDKYFLADAEVICDEENFEAVP